MDRHATYIVATTSTTSAAEVITTVRPTTTVWPTTTIRATTTAAVTTSTLLPTTTTLPDYLLASVDEVIETKVGWEYRITVIYLPSYLEFLGESGSLEEPPPALRHILFKLYIENLVPDRPVPMPHLALASNLEAEGQVTEGAPPFDLENYASLDDRLSIEI